MRNSVSGKKGKAPIGDRSTYSTADTTQLKVLDKAVPQPSRPDLILDTYVRNNEAWFLGSHGGKSSQHQQQQQKSG